MFKRGFTIVELMVVVAIIGILTGIGVVAANQVQKDARDNKRKSDVAAIESELEKFYQEHGSYPAGCTSLCGDSWFFTENVSSGGALITPTATIDDIRVHLKNLPKTINDPLNTTPSTPFNVAGGYFYTAGVHNRSWATGSGVSQYTPGTNKQCGFSISLGTGQASAYVLSYYSEIEDRWVTKMGRNGVKPTLRTDSHASCSL